MHILMDYLIEILLFFNTINKIEAYFKDVYIINVIINIIIIALFNTIQNYNIYYNDKYFIIKSFKMEEVKCNKFHIYRNIINVV